MKKRKGCAALGVFISIAMFATAVYYAWINQTYGDHGAESYRQISLLLGYGAYAVFGVSVGIVLFPLIRKLKAGIVKLFDGG